MIHLWNIDFRNFRFPLVDQFALHTHLEKKKKREKNR